jgi:hypothetical protein
MKSFNFISIIIVLLILVSATCNNKDADCHKDIQIINNSDGAIYFHPSASYPDTITLYPNPSLDPGYFKIEEHTSKKDIYRGCIESKLMTNSEGKVMYFIYDASTLETVPWDTVVKNYMILKRYDLSLEDLQGMNWTITYP